MAELEVPPHVLDRVLNHKPRGVTNVHYNFYTYSPHQLRHGQNGPSGSMRSLRAKTPHGRGADSYKLRVRLSTLLIFNRPADQAMLAVGRRTAAAK
jgi:hypothetical protein